MVRRQTETLDERMITEALSIAGIPEAPHGTEAITITLWSTGTAANTTQPADGPANAAQPADSPAIAVKLADGRDTSTTTDPANDTPEVAPTAEYPTSSVLSTVTNLRPTYYPAVTTASNPPTETP